VAGLIEGFLSGIVDCCRILVLFRHFSENIAIKTMVCLEPVNL
jgi:hypothetical protein